MLFLIKHKYLNTCDKYKYDISNKNFNNKVSEKRVTLSDFSNKTKNSYEINLARTVSHNMYLKIR